jgi:hypothetical protein
MSPTLQPIWRPPQAPWRHLGGVSHQLDTVVRKLDAIPSLPHKAWDAGRSGQRTGPCSGNTCGGVAPRIIGAQE